MLTLVFGHACLANEAAQILVTFSLWIAPDPKPLAEKFDPPVKQNAEWKLPCPSLILCCKSWGYHVMQALKAVRPLNTHTQEYRHPNWIAEHVESSCLLARATGVFFYKAWNLKYESRAGTSIPWPPQHEFLNCLYTAQVVFASRAKRRGRPWQGCVKINAWVGCFTVSSQFQN